MRTKTLLLTAALSVAGVATSMAQGAVYSVNAVGYVNRTAAKNGFSLLANPLDDKAGNKISNVFPITLPSGFTVYTFDATTGFTINTFDPDNGWTDPDQAINPGTGLFVNNPSANDVSLTFVGEVPQGSLDVGLKNGFNLIASKVPQTGSLQTDLKYTPSNGDTVYRYRNGGYLIDSWDPDNGWTGDPLNGPEVQAGEGIYLLRTAAGAATWHRDFSVNNPT